MQRPPRSFETGALVLRVDVVEAEVVHCRLAKIHIAVKVRQEQVADGGWEARMGDKIYEYRRKIEEPRHRRSPALVLLEVARVDAERCPDRLALGRLLDVQPEREAGGVGPNDPVVDRPRE